jgi:outer membrane protein assembly factor BamB
MSRPRDPRSLGAWAAVAVVAVATGAMAGEPRPAAHWPSFRGPHATGIAEGFALPTTWDVPSSKEVSWKTPLPGLGHSSPVIWGDRVFVTTAIGGTADPELKVGMYGDVTPAEDQTVHQFKVLALDRRTGAILWERTAHQGVPRTKRHPKSSHANATPATDGRHLAVFFGSEGLYVYDLDGRLLWKKDLGVLEAAFFAMPEAHWGFASSPIIHDGAVIVLADVLNGSFLAAFDVDDGAELWRARREGVPTWGTPTIHADASRAQVIVNGFRHIGGYDAKTGRSLWRLSGGGDIPVPTPFVAQGLIFVSGAHGGPAPLFAIRTSAEGDISLGPGESSNAHIAWSQSRGGSYIPTPIVYGDLLYVCRDLGVLSAHQATTGAKLYEERLGGSGATFSASAVAGDGKLYFTSELGDVYVVAAGAPHRLLAKNAMGEVTMATPAISEGRLVFRTRGHLVAIGGKPPQP